MMFGLNVVGALMELRERKFAGPRAGSVTSDSGKALSSIVTVVRSSSLLFSPVALGSLIPLYSRTRRDSTLNLKFLYFGDEY